MSNERTEEVKVLKLTDEFFDWDGNYPDEPPNSQYIWVTTKNNYWSEFDTGHYAMPVWICDVPEEYDFPGENKLQLKQELRFNWDGNMHWDGDAKEEEMIPVLGTISVTEVETGTRLVLYYRLFNETDESEE